MEFQKVTAEKESVLITVLDQGPGVDEDERRLIFEKFYRVRENESKVKASNVVW